MKRLRHIPWRRVLLAVLVGLNWLVGAAVVFTGYAGVFSPFELPMAGILAMTFPLWLMALGVLAVVDLCVRRVRWLAVVPALTLAAAWSPFLDFCPLNIFAGGELSPQEKARSFTLLTYNCFHLNDYSGQHTTGPNPAIEYIMGVDADIVALQECEVLQADTVGNISASQMARLEKQYPYRHIDGTSQWNSVAILSKYPFELLPIGRIVQHDYRMIDGYRIDVKGREVTLYNVHLQSLGLSSDDKALYRSLYKGRGETKMAQVRSRLFSKIVAANVSRMSQADLLRTYITTFGGDRIVVTGDFNDIAGCHAMRIISGEFGPGPRLRQVYREVGIGPIITYHAGGFLFHIDHILYHGKLRPHSLRCDHEPWSDHYPQLATFILE